MPTKVSEAVKRQIQDQGFGLVGEIGGIRKQKYYTPDGREILSVPSMREWYKKDAKGNLENGIRDANLDKGWLLQPPQNPALMCPHCDKWHDTVEGIKECHQKKVAFDARWMKRAKKETNKNGDSEVTELKKEVNELKDMVKQLLEREVS